MPGRGHRKLGEQEVKVGPQVPSVKHQARNVHAPVRWMSARRAGVGLVIHCAGSGQMASSRAAALRHCRLPSGPIGSPATASA